MTVQPFLRIPPIETTYWTFSIGIPGQPPFLLTYDELSAMEQEAFSATVVPNVPKMSDALDAHEWRGVSIQSILDTLEVAPSLSWAWIRALDGYTTTLPYQTLMCAFLATEKNGQPLASEEGYPARLIVPGVTGFKMPKWVSRIELGERARVGFWESRGRSLTGAFRPRCALQISQSTLAKDETLSLRVRAYSSAPIAHIGISIDGLPIMPIPFTVDAAGVAEGSTYWIANGFDSLQIRALAVDRLGRSSQSQESIFAPPTPDVQVVQGLR